MAYPMIALTTDGTAFACASVSLTETGLAVLDDDGSRTGFVPYDSLEYVAPTEESRVTEAPMQVLVEDGSSFGAASISQAAKGVAALDASGSRIGFVPYDTLTHVLPASKTGPTLPADATPLESVNVEEEDDGGGPVWKGDEERAAAEDEDEVADSDEESEEADAEAEAEAEADDEANTDAETETENASESDTGAGDRDVGTDDDGPVWGGEPEERSERNAEESSSTDAEAESATEQRTDGSGSGASTPDDEAAGAGEREQEAEESELVVEWSFGDQ